MTLDEFWVLIGAIDRAALESGNEDGAVAPLRQSLLGLTTFDLQSFEENLAHALFTIDGEEYADNAGESGDSGDGFLYCRCYVVACGKQHFQRVVEDPSLMPKSLNQWCESLLYLAAEAWAENGQREPDEWNFETSVSYETGSNIELWPSLQDRKRSSIKDEDPYIEPNFERAVSRAGHSFRAKKFDEVVLLLNQHESQLSKKQQQMLQQARAEQRHATDG